MRNCSSLIDHCYRLIIAKILHMLIKEDGCVGGVTKRDSVVSFLRKHNWITSELRAL
jgi:hypothetical protein